MDGTVRIGGSSQLVVRGSVIPVSDPAGAPASLEELYRRYARRVYATAIRLSGRPELADQLTQDVFVRLWQSMGSFRGESAFETWLHRIVVRVVIDHFRADRRWRQRLESDFTLERHDSPALERSPGLKMDLEREIARLPPGARAVVVLHDIEGYKYDEVAELLGVSIGTVKSQLFRARRLLMEALDR